MNDSFGIFVGILFAVFVMVWGPTWSHVTPKQWEAATTTCTVNGGVKRVEIVSAYSHFEVFCNNGARFNLRRPNE